MFDKIRYIVVVTPDEQVDAVTYRGFVGFDDAEAEYMKMAAFTGPVDVGLHAIRIPAGTNLKQHVDQAVFFAAPADTIRLRHQPPGGRSAPTFAGRHFLSKTRADEVAAAAAFEEALQVAAAEDMVLACA